MSFRTMAPDCEPSRPAAPLNIEEIRDEFPILKRTVHGKPLIYFDNAATSQKPSRVIASLQQYYHMYNANIHRGIHTLAEEATRAYEESRVAVQHFINARQREEIIFTRGTTESINLVAHSYGRSVVQKNDEVVITAMDHHSNIVPWQMLCQEKGAQLKVIPINNRGEIEPDEVKKQLTDKTRILALPHAGNSLGTINPVKKMIKYVHDVGGVSLIDGAQAAPHLNIDVQDIDADFYCLSAHKMYGPTGIGALYGKRQLLETMPPYMGGGEMIKDVSFEKTTYNELPYKFEAGTPHVAGGIAFQEAINFIEEIGKDRISEHETDLLTYATSQLKALKKVTLIGTASEKVAVLSFIINGIHPFDIGQMLDSYGIAIRTGHHCTQPLMDLLNIEGTARASFAIYNTKVEIDYLVDRIQRIISIMT